MSFTYSRLPVAACRRVGVNAGVLLSAFDLESGAVNRSDILGATTGAVHFAARPTFIDLGAGVLNCPPNAREMLCFDGWDVRLSGTLTTADAETVRRLTALSWIDDGRVAPRGGLDLARDFGELWLVFDYGDPAGSPGCFAIHMRNALSDGGFQTVLADAQRARWPFRFTAHCEVGSGEAPFEMYLGARAPEPGSP